MAYSKAMVTKANEVVDHITEELLGVGMVRKGAEAHSLKVAKVATRGTVFAVTRATTTEPAVVTWFPKCNGAYRATIEPNAHGPQVNVTLYGKVDGSDLGWLGDGVDLTTLVALGTVALPVALEKTELVCTGAGLSNWA